MTRAAAWALRALLLLAPSPALADIDVQGAEELMRVSGIWGQLGDLAGQVAVDIEAEVRQSEARLPPAVAERLIAQAKISFAGDRLRTRVRDSLVAHVDAQHLPALLDWFKSPTGVEVVRSEQADMADLRDSTLTDAEDARRFAALTTERKAILQRLVAASRAVDSDATLTIQMAAGVQLGLRSALSGTPRQSLDDALSALELKRPDMVRSIEAGENASFARIYSSNSDAVLEDYVRFLDSPAGSHFTDMEVEALSSALREAGEDFGRAALGNRE